MSAGTPLSDCDVASDERIVAGQHGTQRCSATAQDRGWPRVFALPLKIMLLASAKTSRMTTPEIQSRTDATSPFEGGPIAFVPAIVAGMVTATVVLWVLALQRGASPPDPLMAHLVPWARPMARSDERDQFLYHAGIILTALGGFGGALIQMWLTRARPAPRPTLPAKQAPRKRTRAAHTSAAGGRTATVEVRKPAPARARWVRALPHVLAVIAVGSLLYVPDYRAMAGTFWTGEHFHHWHFYAVLPTYAYLSGLVPVLESYSQYGLGLPIILGNLCRLTGGFSHASIVWLGMTYGVLYFVALYVLLCAWLRDWRWGMAGVAFALLLQQFLGLAPPAVLWQYPSSTVLRSPFDVWVFLLLTGHVYRHSPGYLISAGLIAGVAIFWESDTGIYLAASFVAYCTYLWFDDTASGGWSWMGTGKYAAMVVIAPIAFFFLTWLSVGGAISSAVFWNRFFEPMQLFRSGFGMLPMPAPAWGTLHVFLTPGLYVLVALLALITALRLSAQPWRGGYVLGALGVYGLGVYHQYIGRSHPWNWFHVCIPFVILTTALIHIALQRLEMRLRDRAPREFGARVVVRGAQLAPLILLGTAIVLLTAAPGLRSYPGLLSGRWSIPGLAWDSPGMGFRTLGGQAPRDRFVAVAARVSQIVPATAPVAILSEFDSVLYVMTNRRPFSRFVPLYPAVALDSQADEVVGALHNQDLRYVFWDRSPDRQPWGAFLPTLLTPYIAADFELIDRIEQFEVWRRRSPVPGS